MFAQRWKCNHTCYRIAIIYCFKEIVLCKSMPFFWPHDKHPLRLKQYKSLMGIMWSKSNNTIIQLLQSKSNIIIQCMKMQSENELSGQGWADLLVCLDEDQQHSALSLWQARLEEFMFNPHLRPACRGCRRVQKITSESLFIQTERGRSDGHPVKR